MRIVFIICVHFFLSLSSLAKRKCSLHNNEICEPMVKKVVRISSLAPYEIIIITKLYIYMLFVSLLILKKVHKQKDFFRRRAIKIRSDENSHCVEIVFKLN